MRAGQNRGPCPPEDSGLVRESTTKAGDYRAADSTRIGTNTQGQGQEQLVPLTFKEPS